MIKAYIGLGANLDDPVGQIVAARKILSNAGFVHNIRSSSIYVSSPVGYEDQPNFLNCVVELEVTKTPRELFTLMRSTESKLGRVRDAGNQNAARRIDIDLLIYGDHDINEYDLVVPHPRMQYRLFVLLPLQELNPELARRHASDNEADFAGQELHRLAL